MGAELSPALLRSALELAGAVRAPEDEQARHGSTPSFPERLGAHHVLRYAVAEEAETYRRIMRVLYLEHQAFGLRLRPAQVADRLRERYALTVDARTGSNSASRRLTHWGAVERDHDASLASTAAEWRRNRYTYDVTPAGPADRGAARPARRARRGDRAARHRAAAVDPRRARARSPQELAERASLTGPGCRALFERLLAEVEALHAGALAFMRSLGDLMRAVEQVGEDEFERGKGALLEHLQGFTQEPDAALGRDPRRCSSGSSAMSADQLVERIVAAEEFVALPGRRPRRGAASAARQAELLERWRGLRAWFVGDAGQRLSLAHAQRPGRRCDPGRARDRRASDRAPLAARRSRRGCCCI